MSRSASGLLAFFFLVLALSGCDQHSGTARDDFDLGQVPDFTLTDQNDHPFSRADLEGKVWIASFIFTRCATLCPQVSATMARLQKELTGDVTLVSFTVDPEFDTPAVLKDYSAKYNADAARWHFLTGDQDKMYALIKKGFFLAVEQNQGTARTHGNEVTHSPRLVIVDRRGHIRGLFDGRAVDEQGHAVDDVAKIKARVAELLQEK